jgi:hypothetical protein
MNLCASKFINYLIKKGCEISNEDCPWMKTIAFRNKKTGAEWNLLRSKNSDKITEMTIYHGCVQLGVDQPDKYSDFECDE